ncbi:LOW QUALITY PROTEIN: slit homolog 3 protein-like [Leucoraja erinacea]|uniref:LOW QUALITY PROTEIN: slit homolog 3 protein-like n=1 Tax=Leucoraja erinaceus TaxID=7782 RepID=UPI0024555991|nr:LOW QUALITY PROTEIN: slit homolog 3 protein-like [Leucoraja erinacea]
MGQPWLAYLVVVIGLCSLRSGRTSPQCDCYKCQGGNMELNCSHRSLQSVPPSLPEDTQVLLLSSNSIRSVSLGSFGNLSKLRHLDLSDNRLGRLEGDRPLPLEWLDLSSNALTAIPHLGNLPHLRKLVLDGNGIADLPQGAFEGLVNLTELSIRGNAIGHLPDDIFHPLHNLVHLNLASNRIQDFPNGALDGLEELQSLDISNNSLRAIPTDLFESNEILLYVYLYDNPWHCECGSAEYLKEWMEENDGNVYRYVGEPDSESVVCASPAMWQGWPIVNLTLEQLCPVSTTQTPSRSVAAHPSTLGRLRPIAGLGREGGTELQPPLPPVRPPSLPEDTQVLLLSSNSIRSVSLGSFGNLSKLRHLDLSDNRLGRLEGDRPLPLEWLDLSSNALTAIPHLGNLPHLRKLVLDGNGIADLPQGAFEGLVNLTELSIRGNAIGHLPDHIFHPLHNLVHLNLASNRIQNFPYGALDGLEELQVLDISNNSLRAIPIDLFESNDKLLYVFLYDNPWHCECGSADYLKVWMDGNDGNVYRYVGEPDSESVVCASPAMWQGWPIVNLTLEQLCPVSTTQTPAALSLPTPPPWAVCDPSPGLAGKVGLNCSHRSLQSVPPSLPEDTQVLLLSSNSIRSVSLGSFGNLSKLRHLDLSDNRLGRLEGDRPLPLEWLDLSSNALTAIPHLGNLPHLRKLVLDGNGIADLPQGAFEGLVNLTELSIRGNAIGHLPDHIFHPLHNLVHLNLASNRIQDFPNGALDGLEELDVSDNKLSSLPPSLLGKSALLRLALHGNPWVCNDHIHHLSRWIQANPGKVRGPDGAADDIAAVCSAPVHLNGVPLVRIPLPAPCPGEPTTSSPPSPVAARPVHDAMTAWARRSGLLLDRRGSRPSCWPHLLLHCVALLLVAMQLCALSFYTLGFYRRLYRPLKPLGRGIRLVRYSLALPDLRQVYPPPGPHPNPGLRQVEPLLADEYDAGSTSTQGEADTFTSFQ